MPERDNQRKRDGHGPVPTYAFPDEPGGVRPADNQGRSAARYGLAGAMLVTVAVVAALLVPDRAGNRLTTSDDQDQVASSPTSEEEPEALRLYDNAVDRATSSAPGATSTTTGATSTTTATVGTGPSTTVPGATAGSGASSTTGARSTTTRPPTTAAPTTAAPTTAAPTTVPPPADSGCWNLVMQDDFNGTSLDTSVWQPYESAGNAGHGLRRSSAISVGGGMLTMTAQMIDGTLVSGGMSHRYSQAYGRYEVRVRTDQDPSEAISGLVLTWPQSNVHPRDGENDFYETLATPGDRSQFYSFIHKPFGAQTDQDYTIHPVNASEWHTIVFEWRAGQVKIHRDGELVKTLDETAADLIPDVPHFVAIQLDAWKDAMGAPVSMQVDYIKVYAAC